MTKDAEGDGTYQSDVAAADEAEHDRGGLYPREIAQVQDLVQGAHGVARGDVPVAEPLGDAPDDREAPRDRQRGASDS